MADSQSSQGMTSDADGGEESATPRSAVSAEPRGAKDADSGVATEGAWVQAAADAEPADQAE